MDLVEKVNAYWTDFGLTHYSELFKFQEKLAQLRLQNKISDVIIFSQHYPTVSFGVSKDNNKFSPDFLNEIKKIYDDNDEETIIKHLQNNGIEFFKTSRGGGTAYIGPGQLVTYPIVDFHRIVNTNLGVDKYKSLIDKIMYEVLKDDFNLNVNIVEVAREFNKNNGEMRKNRMDVWLNKNGKNYKIGGKGIHTIKNISYNGFSIYVKPYSLYGFDYILACGYDKDQLDVTCMENELKREIDIYDVRLDLLRKIKEKFNYDKLKHISPEDLSRVETNSELIEMK